MMVTFGSRGSQMSEKATELALTLANLANRSHQGRPHAFQPYQISNSDQSAEDSSDYCFFSLSDVQEAWNRDQPVQDVPEVRCTVVSQGLYVGSVPSSGATVSLTEYAEACKVESLLGIEELVQDRELAVEDRLNGCAAVPCSTRIEGRKGSRKRGMDWTDEETSVLVQCKRACFEDKGSPFRKQKSSATDWEAIAEAVRDNGTSEKTRDQCRLRWDTLVKSHRVIKEQCVERGKEYTDLSWEDTRSLRLATTLKPEWLEVIDSISSKARSRKQSHPSDRFRKSKNGGADDGLVSPAMARTEAGSLELSLEGAGTGSIPPAPVCHEMAEPRQKAVPGFSSLNHQLRATLLDLILSRCHVDVMEIRSLSSTCEWLSIVQNRSRSDVYNDVCMLMMVGLVQVSYDGAGRIGIEWLRLRVFDKFVQKLIEKYPHFDTHKYFTSFDNKRFLSGSTLHLMKVLKLEKCEQLESVDLRGLRKLRTLIISECPVLKEITGWKYLRELGWLKVDNCVAYHDYPGLRSLPALRVCSLHRKYVPGRHRFDVSQCIRLRRLQIWDDKTLKESGDLSLLKCLEDLEFISCPALSTVGLSEVYSLTRLVLSGCEALRSLSDLGHMKELVHISVEHSSLEEISGIEKLVSLETLICSGSKLKHLPDLHHLPELQQILLDKTPLMEDDPSSFYFDKSMVRFNHEKCIVEDVSDVSDMESIANDEHRRWISSSFE